jgi:hypothetical protein
MQDEINTTTTTTTTTTIIDDAPNLPWEIIHDIFLYAAFSSGKTYINILTCCNHVREGLFSKQEKEKLYEDLLMEWTIQKEENLILGGKVILEYKNTKYTKYFLIRFPGSKYMKRTHGLYIRLSASTRNRPYIMNFYNRGVIENSCRYVKTFHEGKSRTTLKIVDYKNRYARYYFYKYEIEPILMAEGPIALLENKTRLPRSEKSMIQKILSPGGALPPPLSQTGDIAGRRYIKIGWWKAYNCTHLENEILFHVDNSESISLNVYTSKIKEYNIYRNGKIYRSGTSEEHYIHDIDGKKRETTKPPDRYFFHNHRQFK